MTQTGVRRQHRRWGVRAFAALLLTLGLLPQSMAAPPVRYNFDHLTTGFELIGQHRDLPCESCHANAIFQGTPRDCAACHGIGTAVRATAKPANHILSTDQCASCHNGVSATGMPPPHIPVGTPPTPCEGCHSITNFTTWAGTKINHLAVTALTCASCHETAAYLGMHPSTNTTAADSRPNATLDANHPKSGDCSTCHDTVTFAGAAARPANHIPPSAPCSQCHLTAGNDALYSVTGTHQGVSGCLTCHGPTVGPFVNVTIVTTPGNHIPLGSADCHGSARQSPTNLQDHRGGLVLL